MSTSVEHMSKASLGGLCYRHPDHTALPHIVSFSGGRSSAALAFMAAEEGLLRSERGDVLLFANTSAEHPGTYEFAAECKARLENEFGLPFFWFEFCTVEDAWRGEYRRKASYRLVKPVPVEDDPDGYRSSGELFEEMVSHQGMLPNPHSRTCTAKLKLYPSHELLAEWLGGTAGPAHSGHHWAETTRGGGGVVYPRRAAQPDALNGGTAPEESVLRRHEFLARLPPSRPAQLWQDFTGAPLPDARDDARPAAMRGPSAAQHVRLLGLRADEPNRVQRVLARTVFAEGATTAQCTVRTQPPGELPYFPLYDSGIRADDVARFWVARDFDLDIPEGAGNCVFCFMKGTRQLVELSNRADPMRQKNTPTDIRWWAQFEQRHAREAPRRNGDGVSRFGLLGVNATTFEGIAQGNSGPPSRYEYGTPACDCTD